VVRQNAMVSINLVNLVILSLRVKSQIDESDILGDEIYNGDWCIL